MVLVFLLRIVENMCRPCKATTATLLLHALTSTITQVFIIYAPGTCVKLSVWPSCILRTVSLDNVKRR